MDNNYAVMTVNKRLYVGEFIDQFEKAISYKKTEKSICILKQIELKEENIKLILEKIGVVKIKY